MKLLEQLIGGFVAPGDENTFETEYRKPDFGNFIMCSKKLLDGGLTIGGLIDELTKLPKAEVPDREENNDYEYPPAALQILPNHPG